MNASRAASQASVKADPGGALTPPRKTTVRSGESATRSPVSSSGADAATAVDQSGEVSLPSKASADSDAGVPWGANEKRRAPPGSTVSGAGPP